MAYTTVDNPELYFQTKLYTGNGSTQSITLDGSEDMQPDWIFLKPRSQSGEHGLSVDSVRGNTKVVFPNLGNTEQTITNIVTAFGSDGFSLGDNAGANNNTSTYVAWNWKAGTSFSNSAGANGADLASSGSYNRTAGFSIVTFTGNATDDQQIYHGLNSVPQMMILKNRTNGNNESWKVYHQAIGNTHALTLDTNAASSANVEFWSDETPTSTVFTVGRQDATNGSGNTHVVYCFSEVKGYSKFGSYVGNANVNGPYIYLGFKPAFLIIKQSSSARNWIMMDNKRSTFNVVNTYLKANSSDAEETTTYVDFLSNGFKCRDSDTGANASGGTYTYMAFAENPFVTSSGVPTTAR